MPLFEKLVGEDRKKAVEAPGKSWKRWAREDLARYWYIILCLFVDLLFILQFVESYSDINDEINLVIMIIAVLLVIPVSFFEYKMYRRLFPERV